MKMLYFFKLMFVLLLYINLNTIVQAQNVNLIDIDKYKNSWPRNNEYSAKNAYAFYKGYSYFTADDGVHGRELWRTDGTSSGTKLVKDVNPGTASSDYDNTNYDIKVSGGKLYFVADGGVGAQGLWVSDGTSAGTHFVANISAGDFVPTPSYLTDVNGTLFFAVSQFDYTTFTNFNQIWKTDGTSAGTVLVADIGNVGFILQQLVNVNGRLFFTFYNNFDNTGDELYTSDGTSAGTHIVADININFFGSSFPSQLTPSNGLLYFIADDGNGGRLWVSDGTSAGTYALVNNNITSYATGDTFAIINNVLYFQGSTAEEGNELCKYDEANPAAGVTFVKDIEAGSNSSYPSFMTNVNGTLFFTIGPAGQDAELWKSNGTDAGTVLVKDINPGGLNGYYGLTSARGILLFAFGNNASGYDLWKSDGTSSGTKIVKDINPGSYSSFPQYLSFNNGLLLFGANDGVNGYELWKSDGTTAGTSMIKDINHSSTSSSNPYSFIATANNKVVFNASDEQYGSELWITDGTVAGTSLVKDIYHGTSGSSPYYFTKFKNKTYFFAGDSSGYRLWKTNGTAAGTQLIPTALDNVYGNILQMIAGNDLMYLFILNFNTFQDELWRSDGTTAGTYILKPDINYNFSISNVIIGNTIYFTNDDFGFAFGNELWKSEGTVATTGIVKDIFPGPQGSYPFDLFNFNGKLYFSAYDGNAPFGNTLWTSDGTDAGTKIVKPILVYYPPFAQAKGKFFFSAENAITKGYELYASDGTAAGTKLVKDISKGPNSSGINTLVSGDTLVYFLADDGIHGQELWKSNGTKDGTSLVKDITPGINPSFINNMVNVHDKLFFVNNDILWLSDGTKKGTNPVKDAVLDGITGISNLTYINGYLYFSGYTYAAGTELYVANVTNTLAPVAMVNNSTVVSGQNENEFAAKLLTNPVKDQLKFTVNVKTQQEARVTIMDMAGRILTNDKQALSAGTNIFSYNTSSWAQGIYMINIVTTKKFTSLLKAVK